MLSGFFYLLFIDTMAGEARTLTIERIEVAESPFLETSFVKE